MNLFDGGPRSTVEVSVGGRDPVTMERVFRVDPSTDELVRRNIATVKPWVAAQPSSHLFVADLTDDAVDEFYSCTLCQSLAPNHVCVVRPERLGLCGAYNWMDCRASFEINPTGPNQPIEKGETLDDKLGNWKGVNEFVYKASRGAVTHYNFYSMVQDPMTTCGCCECISAVLPMCNGIMTVHRDYTGETPCGMKFTTLAGVIGGGQVTPGFVGHSKYNVCQRKFVVGDGGLARVVWMPKILKEELTAKGYLYAEAKDREMRRHVRATAAAAERSRLAQPALLLAAVDRQSYQHRLRQRRRR